MNNIGACDILLIIFITLKLMGIISWSWWLVLSPLIIPLGIVIILRIISNLI